VLDHVVTDSDGKERRIVRYDALKESPKLSVLMDLIDEIDPDENQIAIFSARTNFTEAIQRALDDAGIAYVHYGVENNEEAERKFQSGEARIFLSNQQPSAYGLNCLAKCCYAIYACADHRAEIFYQSKHRLLRGQLTEPKFAYHICMRASIEEKIIRSLGRGIELINETNNKNTFLSGGDEDGGL
jgi:SNF2 family DNA or RNA helicase